MIDKHNTSQVVVKKEFQLFIIVIFIKFLPTIYLISFHSMLHRLCSLIFRQSLFFTYYCDLMFRHVFLPHLFFRSIHFAFAPFHLVSIKNIYSKRITIFEIYKCNQTPSEELFYEVKHKKESIFFRSNLSLIPNESRKMVMKGSKEWVKREREREN